MSNVDLLTMRSIICSIACKVDNYVFMGCATSAPDGSSPQGYSRFFLGIGSKVFAPCLVFLHKDRHKKILKIFSLLLSFYRLRDQCSRWE
jgi:hypothetical protein